MTVQNAIEIRGLTKQFADFKLNNIDLTLPSGSIMGLIGENGAGKTTTIKLILNQLHRDSGQISVLGMDNLKQEQKIKRDIGVVLPDGFFFESFTPAQIAAVMSGIYPTWDNSHYSALLSRFSVSEKKPLKECSTGMKAKIRLAAAMAHRPKLLILDEPTSGLDPVMRAEMLDLFQEFIQDEEHSILVSSHITGDLEKIADYITFIHKGSVILSDEKDRITESYGILRCGGSDLAKLPKEDLVSAIWGDFSCQALVRNRRNFAQKYPHLLVESASLEDIMLFTVKNKENTAK